MNNPTKNFKLKGNKATIEQTAKYQIKLYNRNQNNHKKLNASPLVRSRSKLPNQSKQINCPSDPQIQLNQMIKKTAKLP